jgi:hypothetical protein
VNVVDARITKANTDVYRSCPVMTNTVLITAPKLINHITFISEELVVSVSLNAAKDTVTMVDFNPKSRVHSYNAN